MMGILLLFLLKAGSRNQLNNNRANGNFQKNYVRLFGMKLPHMDMVNIVMCAIPNALLDKLKMNLMSLLFEQKWLRKYRLLDIYYLIAVDATGIVSFDRRHCPHCLTKTIKEGKNGRKLKKAKTIYFHYVLEAKLVTSNGLALSLASEWIENPVGDFVKQDCERKAFVRLAAKLKEQYPRLPVCILADGLYPYENAFKICEDNGWKFIFVLKDESLKTVQEELTLTRLGKPAFTSHTNKTSWRIKRESRYHTDIAYHNKYTLNWMQCVETRTQIIDSKKKTPDSIPKTETSCFEYVTNIKPDDGNVETLCSGGRLRWKIENEGFNTQKNNGYALEHKFVEKSYNGLQNYYTILQIAHAINQLLEKGKTVTEIRKQRPKETITNLWDNLRGFLIYSVFELCNSYIEFDDEIEHEIEPAPS